MLGSTRFPTRRGLLGAIAGAGLAGLARPVLRAQSVRGSRALVCIYILDGNDSNNMVVPLDSGRYASYAQARGSLALDRSSLLVARTPGGEEIGFHPSMVEMRDLFAMQRLAVVANVGAPDGKPPVSLLDPGLTYFSGMAAPKWAAAFTGSGAINLEAVTTGYRGKLAGSGIVRLAPDARRVPAAGAGGLSTPFPDTEAGARLQQVAGAIAQSRDESQFFFVPLAGFATRTNQLPRHAAALQELSQAMAACLGS